MAIEWLGDHRPHVAAPRHRGLAADEPQRKSEDDDRAHEDRDVDLPLRVHPQHEGEHDHRHGRPHDQRHVGPRLGEEDVLPRIGVQVHQDEHHHRGGEDHQAEADVGHALLFLRLCRLSAAHRLGAFRGSRRRSSHQGCSASLRGAPVSAA